MKNWLLALLLIPTLASAAVSELDRAVILGGKNVLANPGFESSTASWAVSGGGAQTVTTAAANVDQGNASGQWDASATDQIWSTANNTVTDGGGLARQNITASCRFKCAASSTCTHKIELYDGTNVLQSVSITSSSTQFVRTSATVLAPSSGTVRLQIRSQANEPNLFVDGCYLGLADGFNMAQVSQATFFGGATSAVTASCAWSTTSASFASFAADTDCPTATVSGNASAPATKIPGITFTSLPPGDYLVVVSGSFISAGVGTPAMTGVYTIYDGTTNSGNSTIAAFQGSVNNMTYPSSIMGRFTYTAAQTSLTFQVQAKTSNASNAAYISNDTAATARAFEIYVYRFPTVQETAYRAEVVPGSWAGYHDTTCSNTITNTALTDLGTDASCALVETINTNFGSVAGTNTNLEIAVTPKVTGVYNVCAMVSGRTAGAAGTAVSFALNDNTSSVYVAQGSFDNVGANSTMPVQLCGHVSMTANTAKTLRIRGAASTSTAFVAAGQGRRSTVEWSIFPVTMGLPTPQIVGGSVAMSAVGSPATGTINGSFNDVIYGTTTFDTTSSYNATTGVYTAPFDGKYHVDCNVIIAGTFALNSSMQLCISKNNSATCSYIGYVRSGGAMTSGATSSHVDVSVAAGDTLRCKILTDATSNSYSSTAGANTISIHRIGN